MLLRQHDELACLVIGELQKVDGADGLEKPGGRSACILMSVLRGVACISVHEERASERASEKRIGVSMLRKVSLRLYMQDLY